jgi:hypothetical protein
MSSAEFILGGGELLGTFSIYFSYFYLCFFSVCGNSIEDIFYEMNNNLKIKINKFIIIKYI